MKRKTTAVLLLQRSEWFNEIDHQDAIVGLDEGGDRIVHQLSQIIDIVQSLSISTVETAEAVSVRLRSMDTDLVILLYQTRVDAFYLERILKGVGKRPLVVWCYLPWRRIPQSMTYEDLVMGSSFFAMIDSLAHLRALNMPYLAAFGSADDPSVMRDIQHFALAAQVSTDLRRTKLGMLAGEGTNKLPPYRQVFLDRLGINLDIWHYEQLQPFLDYVNDSDVEVYVQQLLRSGIESMVTDDTLRRAARIQLGLQDLARQHAFDYLAIPDHSVEFRSQYGVCPGLPPSPDFAHLTTHTIPSLQIEAIASSIILNQIAGSHVFLLRMWFWERAKNIVVGGHAGGQYPYDMSQGARWIIGDYECQRGDPDGGAQIEFVTKPGRVTLLQIHITEYVCKARALTGVCLESEPWIEGIPHTIVRLDCSIDFFLERISETGGSPYWVLVYGDHLSSLKALFELQSIDFDILHD